MEIDINLELSRSSSSSQESDRSHMVEEEYENTGKPHQPPQLQPQQQQHKNLSIFYDGKMCVFDVTEIQAAAILMFAKKETGGEVRSRSESKQSSAILQSNYEQSRPSTGLMMKRSLQRFLQKRKNRIQEACPYHH